MSRFIVCQAFDALKPKAQSVTKLMDDGFFLDPTEHKLSWLRSGCLQVIH